MVQLSDNDMATPGDVETPPATTEAASPHSSVRESPEPERVSLVEDGGSPDPPEPMVADVSDDVDEAGDDANCVEGEPLIELPGTPSALTEEELATADAETCVLEDDEVFAAQEKQVSAPPTPEETADTADEVPMKEEIVVAEEAAKLKSASMKGMEEPNAVLDKAGSLAEKKIACMKEKAQLAMDDIGNKMSQFFSGNMRKVKSLLHINESTIVEKIVDEGAKNLSSSTGDLKMANAAKSRLCIIL